MIIQRRVTWETLLTHSLKSHQTRGHSFSSPRMVFTTHNTRARVLGGGSVINAGFYTRAGNDYVEEAEWVREEVEAAYEWVEKKLVFEPRVMGWQTAFKDGLLEAGVNPYNGFTYDHIYGTKIGGTIFDNAGHRHTAANLLEYANPDNIVVYLHASVQKILFTKTGIDLHSLTIN